ncbi:unnamed protein product [Ectocarpus sp. CCAP 1310/34]|nr:unnamed protein product [Ectocarpus sp. CCAP 1310/34]
MPEASEKSCVAFSPNPDDFVLTITTCDFNGSSVTGSVDTINFYTCSGGPYCAMADSPETEAVFGDGEIRDLVFLDDVEPTTLVISKPVGDDGWCVNGIQWQGVDMLAPTTVLIFDISDGNTGNCVGGLLDYTDEDNEYLEENLVYPCLEEWRIFNLQGDADYEYELKVQGCDGVDTTPVTVSFCPDTSCSTADVVTQTLTAFGSGMTTFPVQLDFNPAAMQLLASGSDVWCADALLFNQFDLAENYPYSLEPEESSTVTNLQLQVQLQLQLQRLQRLQGRTPQKLWVIMATTTTQIQKLSCGPSLEVRWRVYWRLSPSSQLSCSKLAA